MNRKLTKEQQRIREELNSQGWTLVDTTRFFTKCPFRWSVKEEHGYGKVLYNCHEYKSFMFGTIQICLNDEGPLYLDHIEARCMATSHAKGAYPEWHPDGGYVRFITPILGLSTEFKPRQKSPCIFNIPRFYSLIFTALERFRCRGIPTTLHRTPECYDRRKLIVGTVRKQTVVRKDHEEQKREAQIRRKRPSPFS